MTKPANSKKKKKKKICSSKSAKPNPTIQQSLNCWKFVELYKFKNHRLAEQEKPWSGALIDQKQTYFAPCKSGGDSEIERGKDEPLRSLTRVGRKGRQRKRSPKPIGGRRSWAAAEQHESGNPRKGAKVKRRGRRGHATPNCLTGIWGCFNFLDLHNSPCRHLLYWD